MSMVSETYVCKSMLGEPNVHKLRRMMLLKKTAKSTGQEKRQLTVKKQQHLAMSDIFYAQLQEVQDLLKDDSEAAGICFNFEENLPLPVTNIGQEYYKRRLWLYNFGVMELKTKPNEVLSCLL
jgi:hypothetical protein